jgi:trk system potassium uptake protein TrkA
LAEKIRNDAPVLVIGLGRFGAATAGELTRLDREVLAVESDSALVQTWSDRVTHAVEADARKIDALRQIGAQDFSIAVVAVGSSIEASVLITANLVDLGVPQIWAKAISQSHGKILSRIGANHVVYPEAEAGERVAHLVSGRLLDFIEFDDDFALVKLYPPKLISGIPLSQTQVRKKFGVTVVGVKAAGKEFTYATPDTVLNDDDIIIVSGNSSDIEKFSALKDAPKRRSKDEDDSTSLATP